MMCCLSCCRWSSLIVACCVSCVVMHFGKSVVSIALMFFLLPGILSSLFFMWFCLDSQYVMNRSGPDLYYIPILYWWGSKYYAQ